jgi:hypothetical protein
MEVVGSATGGIIFHLCAVLEPFNNFFIIQSAMDPRLQRDCTF